MSPAESNHQPSPDHKPASLPPGHDSVTGSPSRHLLIPSPAPPPPPPDSVTGSPSRLLLIPPPAPLSPPPDSVTGYPLPPPPDSVTGSPSRLHLPVTSGLGVILFLRSRGEPRLPQLRRRTCSARERRLPSSGSVPAEPPPLPSPTGGRLCSRRNARPVSISTASGLWEESG